MNVEKIMEGLNFEGLECDYADVRIEKVFETNIAIKNGELINASESPSLGAAIRVLKDGNWAHFSTTKIETINEDLKRLCSNVSLLPKKDKINWPKREAKHYEAIKYKDVSCLNQTLEEKINFLKSLMPTLESFKEVTGPLLAYKDTYKEKWFKAKDKVSYHYDYNSTGVYAGYTLKDGDDQFEDGTNVFLQNIEGQKEKVIAEITKDITEGLLFIHAPTVPAGKYQVVLDPHITGIFTHESFGHKSEADFMLGDDSMKEEWKMGKVVGSEILSIVDDGNSFETSGDLPIDDDGNPTKKTYLIKNGKLAGRLHSTETAILLDEEITGNARAKNFEFQPIVRMTNTYIENGTQTFDELISNVKDGLLLKGANHGMGMSTFTIAPKKAFWIRDGKIAEPAKVSVISGNVMETLNLIEGIANDIYISSSAFGGCGKAEQWPLPVADGGPSILVKEMTVS